MSECPRCDRQFDPPLIVCPHCSVYLSGKGPTAARGEGVDRCDNPNVVEVRGTTKCLREKGNGGCGRVFGRRRA